MITKLLPFAIGTRYTRAHGRNHFISFISLTSMLGIALGVMVLITVLSVMNGFNKEIRTRILSMTPHLTVVEAGHWMTEWSETADYLQSRVPILVGTTPFIDGQGMLLKGKRMQGVLLRGILPDRVDTVFPLSQAMKVGTLADLQRPYGVLIGKALADSLGVHLYDKVALILPDAQVGIAGITPRVRQLTVVGIYESGYLYDYTHLFMQLPDMAQLFKTHGAVSGLQLRLEDPFIAPRMAQVVRDALGPGYVVEDWTVKYANYFQAIQMEKTIMFFILLLIIVVAAFNMVSSLVMLVTDKTADIAILRVMGASKGFVMTVFIWQGVMIGCMGTALGAGLGVLLSHHVSEISAALEKLLHRQLLSTDIYFLDFLPSDFHMEDALWVCASALVISFLATLYPAWRAASIQPAEALRYA